MPNYTLFRGTCVAACLLATILSPVVHGQNAPLRVLVSNGLKGSMEELQPKLEKAIGRRLSVDYSATANVKRRIEGGEAFDVTLITSEAIDDLAKQGKANGGSKVSLGKSQLGIGYRSGTAKPDLGTAESFKRALLNAKSITFPKDGASRGYLEKTFEKMGIAKQLQPKIILADGSAASTASVAAGKAELVITLFSEIIPVKGVEIAGSLPGEYKYDISFAGALSAKTQNSQAGEALLRALGNQDAKAVMRKNGVQ